MNQFEPLVVSLRGPQKCQETLHLGSIAVVDGDGNTVYQLGAPEERFPLRSTIKSIQLLPLLLDGLDSKYELTHADLAVMMSSHHGEEIHTQRVSRLLNHFELELSQLRCGTHPPHLEHDRLQLLLNGTSASVLHCNCSGKHTGMLAVCAENGWPLESYLEVDHPLQKRILKLIRQFAEIPDKQELNSTIDGCSLPTYSLSLIELARIFSRLANPDLLGDIEQQPAAPLIQKLRVAAHKNPEMITGSKSFDTQLMTRYGDQLFAKSGADGMYAMALSPSQNHPRGLGIAYKVADGDPGSKIRELVAVSVLRQLEPDNFTDIEEFIDTRRLNNVGTVVGSMQTVFKLGVN